MNSNSYLETLREWQATLAPEETAQVESLAQGLRDGMRRRGGRRPDGSLITPFGEEAAAELTMKLVLWMNGGQDIRR